MHGGLPSLHFRQQVSLLRCVSRFQIAEWQMCKTRNHQLRFGQWQKPVLEMQGAILPWLSQCSMCWALRQNQSRKLCSSFGSQKMRCLQTRVCPSKRPLCQNCFANSKLCYRKCQSWVWTVSVWVHFVFGLQELQQGSWDQQMWNLQSCKVQVL